MSEIDSLVQQEIEVQTIKFCKECHNLLEPNNEGDNLIYKCTRRDCSYKLKIEGKN